LCPLPHAPLANLDDVGQLDLKRPRLVEGRLAGLWSTRPERWRKHQAQKGTRPSLLGTGSYRLNKPRAAVLLYGCTAPFPQHCPLLFIALTLFLAVRSAPAARSASTTAVEHPPKVAAKWKAVLSYCERARKGTRHRRCSEHNTRAAQHWRARPGVTFLGSRRGTHQQGLGYELLCPVLKQPGREQVVWACCRNSMPWCSNAMKLGKQHRAGALSRSLNSPLGRRGSLFKFNVIVCVVARAGLVRVAHACLCSWQALVQRCTLKPSLPSFPSHKASSGARTQSLTFGSAPWARRSSIAATWPFITA